MRSVTRLTILLALIAPLRVSAQEHRPGDGLRGRGPGPAGVEPLRWRSDPGERSGHPPEPSSSSFFSMSALPGLFASACS